MKNRFEKCSDDQLLKSFSEGSNEAFDTLIYRYDAPLHTYIRMTVGDPCLADDIFQDTFIKVIDKVKAGDYEAQGKFQSWIFRIARNLMMDYFRHQKVRNVISLSEESAEVSLIEKLPSAELSIEEQLCRNNDVEMVRAWVSLLPKEQREVLMMRYLDELSFKEIACKTGVSINTALGRMRYALINLRKYRDAMPQF